MTAMRSATPKARSRSCETTREVTPVLLVQLHDFLGDNHGGNGIQFAGGFIVKDQLGLDHQRPGDGDALLHAAGKFAGHLVLRALEPDNIQLLRDNASGSPPEISVGARSDRGRRSRLHVREFKQRAGLEHHRHPVFGHGLRRGNGFAVNEDLTRIGFFQANEMLQEDRLCRCRWAP